MVKTHDPKLGASMPSGSESRTASSGSSDGQLEAGPAPASYEAALAELERLVASMEAGQLPLESMLEGYRRGATLLAFCRGRLEAVEQQVRVLEDGQLKPWVETP